jgi:hypothetical protein
MVSKALCTASSGTLVSTAVCGAESAACFRLTLSAARQQQLLLCELEGQAACGWPIRPRPG